MDIYRAWAESSDRPIRLQPRWLARMCVVQEEEDNVKRWAGDGLQEKKEGRGDGPN